MSTGIYKWVEPCKCLEKFGYSGVKEWWELYQMLDRESKNAYCNGDVAKQFIYRDAAKIVYSDGMKRCTCRHNHDQN